MGNKAKSIFKKIKAISKNGLKPYAEGKKNFNDNSEEWNNKALERLEACSKCPLFQEEPINDFKVEDKTIPELSNKMCSACGCTSAYLLRQDLKICKKWSK